MSEASSGTSGGAPSKSTTLDLLEQSLFSQRERFERAPKRRRRRSFLRLTGLVSACLASSCLVLPRLDSSYLILSCLVLPRLVSSCLVLPRLASACLVLSRVVPGLSRLVSSCLVLSRVVTGLSRLVRSCLVLSGLDSSLTLLFTVERLLRPIGGSGRSHAGGRLLGRCCQHTSERRHRRGGAPRAGQG